MRGVRNDENRLDVLFFVKVVVVFVLLFFDNNVIFFYSVFTSRSNVSIVLLKFTYLRNYMYMLIFSTCLAKFA